MVEASFEEEVEEKEEEELPADAAVALVVAAAVMVAKKLANVPSALKSYPAQFFLAHWTALGRSALSHVSSTQVR